MYEELKKGAGIEWHFHRLGRAIEKAKEVVEETMIGGFRRSSRT
jgi:hypothetical protein